MEINPQMYINIMTFVTSLCPVAYHKLQGIRFRHFVHHVSLNIIVEVIMEGLGPEFPRRGQSKKSTMNRVNT